jgi:hypothetical protein
MNPARSAPTSCTTTAPPGARARCGYRAWNNALADVFAEADARGALRPGTVAATAARFVVALTAGATTLNLRTPSCDPRRRP